VVGHRGLLHMISRAASRQIALPFGLEHDRAGADLSLCKSISA